MIDPNLTPWMTFEDLSQRLVSYAQNQEDVLLQRIWKDDPRGGFYVDIGANHPVFHSVTKHFSNHGWRGINVEPNPLLHRLLVEDRPDDINLNIGAGAADSSLTFYEFPVHGWSTFVPGLAEYHRTQGMDAVERTIAVRTLDTILEQHVPAGREIDFLKVDVEGFEPQVFEGVDLRRWRPRVILVESNGREAWEPRLLDAGYAPAAFDGINRYYAGADDRAALEALSTPINVLDFFIPYDQLRLLRHAAELDLGPASIRVLRGMKWFSRHHPNLARLARRMIRRAG